jgi:uncharacterized protein (TIGR00290 family)
MPTAAISWSAGKDCTLALLRAREAGFNVRTFVTMCEEDGMSKAHSLPPEVIEAQVQRFGGDWLGVRVPPGRYAEVFAATLANLAARGHTHVVFGDIDLQAHRDWLEPACVRAGLGAVFPLWRESRQALAAEIIGRGIRAYVVGVDTRRLDESYCGLDYDKSFLLGLPEGVCPCGEDGEFHTFVYDSPGMTSPVAIARGARRLVASTPPMNPTMLAFQELRIVKERPSQ